MHTRDDEHQMIFTLGPRGHTLGLPLVLYSLVIPDLEYHGLFISYRWNQPHREAVERALNNHQSVLSIQYL